jgi:PIN domain nuclease of toxin-antitoxin system
MSADVVLDASAVLALLGQEPGAEVVERRLRGAVISAVNLAEVVAVLVRRGMPVARVREIIEPFDLDVQPFDSEDAYHGGEISGSTKAAGLSLGDRACLAAAKRLGRPVLTAERSWAGLKVGVKIELVR